MNAPVAIGLPVYNGSRHLAQALDCLLAQSFGDFRVVVLNDGSTDASEALLQPYLARDRRLHYVRHDTRRGLVEAWRRSAQLAGELFAPRYFAWYSDHDWVAADWLEQLYAVISRSSCTVLAHAQTSVMDEAGQPLGETSEGLDTGGLGVFARIDRAVFSNMGAGDAVYGLFRWDALAACGIFQDEIMPDRLLVAEVNLHGDVRHVEAARRFRRQTHRFDGEFELIDRQLRTLFPDGYVKDAPYTAHATHFLRRMYEEAAAQPARLARAYLAFSYYQRSLRKFREPLEQELAALPISDGTYAALVRGNIADPVLIPAASHDAAIAAWQESKEEFKARVQQRDKQIRALSEQQERAESDLATTRTALAESSERAARLADELAVATSRLQKAQERGDRFEVALADVRPQAAKLAGELEVAASRLQKAQERGDRFEADLVAARAAAKEAMKAQARAEDGHRRAEIVIGELGEANRAQQEALQASLAAQRAMAADIDQLRARLTTLHDEVAGLQTANAAMHAHVVSLTTGLEASAAERSMLQGRLESMKRDRGELERRYRFVRVAGIFAFALLKLRDLFGLRRPGKLSSQSS